MGANFKLQTRFMYNLTINLKKYWLSKKNSN